MVSPLSPLSLQPLTRSLSVPVRLAGAVSPWAARPCDSCRSVPASFTLTWPDVRFRVCSPCLPPVTPAGSVLGVVALPAAHQPRRPATATSSCSAAASVPARSRSTGAAPSRALVASAVPAASDSQPAGATVVKHAEREVLHAAARTVLTSPPSLRGRRLSPSGRCDVVAALVLAAGGAVDETGRPSEPTERLAAQLLRQALRHVADQLAGCAAGRSWIGDPVALIDAWQAHPELTRSARAEVLNAAAGQASHPGSASAAAAAGAAAQAAADAGKAAHRQHLPTSPAALEPVSIGARS